MGASRTISIAQAEAGTDKVHSRPKSTQMLMTGESRDVRQRATTARHRKRTAIGERVHQGDKPAC